MTDPRKVIKRIRKVGIPLDIEDPVDVRLAEAEGQFTLYDEFQSQVAIIRDRNLDKAKQAREVQLELRRYEKERMEEINEERLKNLKKARKKLARMRNAKP